MAIALVIASAGLDPSTVDRTAALRESLDHLPAVHSVRCVQISELRAALGLAASADEDVLVIDGRLVAHGAALRAIGNDGRLTTAVLVGPPAGEVPSTRALILDDGVVVTAGSPLHQPIAGTAEAQGALRIAAGDLAVVTGGLDDLERAVGPGAFRSALSSAPVEVLVAALTAAGLVVPSVAARHLVAVRPSDQQQAQRALVTLDHVDERQAWLANAVKPRDGWFTTFFVSPYSKHVARWCADRGLSPNQVTMASLLVGIASGVSFAVGSRLSTILGAVLLQIAFSLDCVDGQLARYTQTFTPFGSWLDSVADRAKEYLVYLGLAIGGQRVGEGDEIWLLALVAMAVQMVRHGADVAHAAARPAAVARPAPLARSGPSGAATATPTDGQPAARDAAAVSTTLLQRAAGMARWVRRILGLPIGERFAIVSVGSIIGGPRVVFLVLAIWGGFSVAARLVLQVGQSIQDGRGLTWLVRLVPRFLELGVVILAAIAQGPADALFLYLLAVAARYYDVVYRSRVLGTGSLASPLRATLDAWYVRVLILLVASWAGALQVAAPALGVALVIGAFVDAVGAWTRHHREVGEKETAGGFGDG